MAWEHEGSVSHGTLREADLIPAFFGALKKINSDAATELSVQYEYGPELTESWLESVGPDTVESFIDDLDSALNEEAPETHYFGTTEGDGSDYGFWPIYL